MYRCYHPKRFFALLVMDIAIILLCMVCSLIGKAVFSEETPTDGVFLPVVMYHSITEPNGSDYRVSAATLERDLQYLKDHGYTAVSVEELVAYTNGNGTLPEHPVLLTFDDGFYNNLSTALPLLEQYDMCAVVSIVGYYTDVTAANDPHVDTYSYLTWDDVQTLADSGRVEIGSHTYHLHSNAQRAGCSIMYGEAENTYQEMLTQDLSLLQTEMRSNLNMEAIVFAYPFGFVCRESIPILKEQGFLCTLTCYERPNYITRDSDSLYGLNRYNRSAAESTEAFFERILKQ